MVVFGDQRVAVIGVIGARLAMPHVRAGLCGAEHRAERRVQDEPSRRSSTTANAPQLSIVSPELCPELRVPGIAVSPEFRNS
jgi:hypothetical protein